MSIIQVNNLSKNYTYYKKQPGLLGSVKTLFYREKLVTEAVKNISFNIELGELVGFLGPNGAGKTTTLKMLSGILYPTSGEAKVLGYTPWKRQNEYKKQFAIVMGQKNQLWWDLPAMESFVFNKEIYEISNKQFEQTTNELIEVLDIKHILNTQIRKLSLGERMKCELVAALLHNPKVLFLDEPTIGLDIVAQKKIRDFIKKYNQEKKTTIILTSHYMDDIQELAKRIIIIDLGKIIYDGSLTELTKRYVKHKILKLDFKQTIKKEEIERFGLVTEFYPTHAIIEIPQKNVKTHIANILNSNLPIDDFSLEDVEAKEVVREIFTKRPT